MILSSLITESSSFDSNLRATDCPSASSAAASFASSSSSSRCYRSLRSTTALEDVDLTLGG